MGRKSPEDLEMEERVRAHVRERMTTLRIGVTRAAEMVGCSQGNLTKILQGQRGLGLGMAVRMIVGLKMEPARVLLVSPDPKYFEAYVPRAPDESAPTHPKRGK